MQSAKSSSNSRGFSLIEVIISMALLTSVSLGVAQVFAMSTRMNFVAHGQTSATSMAEQKLEQLRGLTWGFDLQGQGLPLSDTTSNLAVTPPTRAASGSTRHRPTRSSRTRQVTSIISTRTARGSALARPPRLGGLYPALVDHAAADQPEQHAGAAGARHAGLE